MQSPANPRALLFAAFDIGGQPVVDKFVRSLHANQEISRVAN